MRASKPWECDYETMETWLPALLASHAQAPGRDE